MSNDIHPPEIVKLLMTEPGAPRLVRALLEAAAWIASPDARQFPVERSQIADELGSLVQLERDMTTMAQATETRWDGRSSAFLQADAVAREDRVAWLQSLHRLADTLDAVRRRPGPPAP